MKIKLRVPVRLDSVISIVEDVIGESLLDICTQPGERYKSTNSNDWLLSLTTENNMVMDFLIDHRYNIPIIESVNNVIAWRLGSYKQEV